MIPKDDEPAIGPLLETYSLEGTEGAPGPPGAEFVRFEIDAIGTRNVFLLRGDDEAKLGRAAHEGMQLLDRIEQKLSKFLPESEVSVVNQLAAREPVLVGEELFELLQRSREAWEVTRGAFDPTVAPLLDAWGFVAGGGRVPTDTELDRLLELRGMHLGELDEARSAVRFQRAGMAIDLGGIGKGYAADRLAELFRAHGVDCGAVVCGRSTVVTWGTPEGEGRWRFEVVDPLKPTRAHLTLAVDPGAVSSSGAYERMIRHEAVDYGHVFDPATGRPAETSVRGVTVWTESALLGDVLSTAIFLNGRDALTRDGVAETRARAWSPAASAPRLGVLLLEDDPGSDSGLHTTFHSCGDSPFSCL